MSVRHFPLQLELQHMALCLCQTKGIQEFHPTFLCPHHRNGSPHLQRHLIHSEDMDGEHHRLSPYLAEDTLGNCTPHWSSLFDCGLRGKSFCLIELCFMPRVSESPDLYSIKLIWRPISVWTRVSTFKFDFLNWDLFGDNSTPFWGLQNMFVKKKWDDNGLRLLKKKKNTSCLFSKKKIPRVNEVYISWGHQPRI